MLALGIGAGLMVLAGCSDLYEADPLLAAQADSSAAGYEVGARAGSTSQPAPTRSGRRPTTEAGPTVAMTTPAPPPSPRAASTRADATAMRDSTGRSDSARTNVGPAHPVTRSDSGARTPVRTGADVATLPPELSAPADDSVVVDTFLSFNPSARTVWVDLIAGFDGANDALNFNGGFEGAHTLVVPVGWRVEMRFLNRDGELAHSAIVVKAIDPIPMIAPPAAFPNAFTISLEEGILEGRSDVMRFSADTEGRYAIHCAVPGHAQSGMWVRFDIVRSATVPEYRRR